MSSSVIPQVQFCALNISTPYFACLQAHSGELMLKRHAELDALLTPPTVSATIEFSGAKDLKNVRAWKGKNNAIHVEAEKIQGDNKAWRTEAIIIKSVPDGANGDLRVVEAYGYLSEKAASQDSPGFHDSVICSQVYLVNGKTREATFVQAKLDQKCHPLYFDAVGPLPVALGQCKMEDILHYFLRPSIYAPARS